MTKQERAIQTVDIRFPNSYVKVQDLEMRPELPDDLFELMMKLKIPIQIIRDTDETIFTWEPNGIIDSEYYDGTKKTWWPCPSLNEAVKMSTQTCNDCVGTCRQGLFYQFVSQREIFLKWEDRNYVWKKLTPNVPRNIITGIIGYGVLDEEQDSWYFVELLPEIKLHSCGNKFCIGDCGIQACGHCIDICKCDC